MNNHKEILELIREEKERQKNAKVEIDIESILRAAENVDDDFFTTTSLTEIAQEIVESMQNIHIPGEIVDMFSGKLLEYRFVDQIHHLRKSRYLRWIRRDPDMNGEWKLSGGAILVNVKFSETGVQLVCKSGPRFMQIRFDNYLIYQKLTSDEQLILSCYNATS
jgi:hypothetical protein